MRTEMMKSFARTSLPLAAASLAAILCAACEPMEPQTAYACSASSHSAERSALSNVPLRWSPEGGYYEATVPDGAKTVYVILGDQPVVVPPTRLTPPPAVVAAPVVQPVAAPEPPPPPENPFASVRSWTGKYVCTQGLTDMTFRITSVNGPRMDAVFSFLHADSGASGSYRMSGFYDVRSHKVVFEPGEWIERPPNYVTISMQGRVVRDGNLFVGHIPHPGCSWFRLRPGR